MKFDIEVTQEDIDRGVRASESRCFLSRAADRVFPNALIIETRLAKSDAQKYWVSPTDNNHVGCLYVLTTSSEIYFRLPEFVTKNLMDWDEGIITLTPFSFEVNL